ncbi:hypothetical protein [Streptomyces olivochromogenes]|nr:hypothetical protein [Streptomyces olivochromogenes]MCF3131948.1 hypothetical protein [Streptomyces olivochromogenes]
MKLSKYNVPIVRDETVFVYYGAKFPKSVAKVVDDEDVLLAFYDYPAEH